ncbi:hypothetical protein Acr_00g0099840 [Actinidia rufa]|uniref:Uncharacterized protein n=1 Tax=Actinidia rufa TaxID=165716 RepID=A0A7J0E1F3_9ERIC|nr:hypothetical protein Acr_00g0099840 [Actinidia rufa]
MALNWAHLLIHDDEVLAQFHVDHRILDDDVYLGGNEEEGNEDAEVEDGEEVNQVPVIAPSAQILGAKQIVVQSSNSKAAADLILPIVEKRKGKQPTEGTSYQKRGKAVGSSYGSPKLWALTFTIVELGKQLFQQNVSTSTRLNNYTADLKGANQKIHGLEKDLKQTSWRSLLGRKTKLNKKWLISKKWHVVKCIGRWLISLRELRIPVDHPTWVALALSVELPDPSATYPPILLPDFNEKDYVTLLAEREDVNAIVAQGNKLSRVEGVVAKGADGIENEGENLFEE